MPAKYRIVKYKGKTKIKDTKTGKSAEIDIEKFMNGGYKTISEYALGGEEECPEGDVECMERKRIGMPPAVSSDLQGFVPQNPMVNATQASVNSPIVDENTVRPNVQSVNSLQPQGLAPSDSFSKITAPGISGELDSKSADVEINADSEQVENRIENNYTIPNPYAGVDIPTAANHLGQSIGNKNALGMAASSLKILAGLGRNVVSGLGQQNRYNQVMKDYYTKQKNSKNPVQYFAYGGKKDEELATGEYMHGVSNEDMEQYNAEIEQGEYFQTNEGDIAEVVGKKHSQGGEKIQMEEEDRVLSDKLKLGGKTAKMLSSKYDLKLKAKNTYSDVLDKFRKKMKLDTLLEEESDILKKIGDQDKVTDSNTKNFNLQVLTQKQDEIKKQKHPIEEMRKEMFEELFNIQEDSKTGSKKDKFEEGGKRDLDQEDLQSINQSTGTDFTLEGVNELFEFDNGTVNESVDPELNLGKYTGLNYFNLDYSGDEFTVSPTKNNPSNAAKHREYLKYLQKQNPNLKINTKANGNGYLPMNQRLEYGGKLGELAKEYNIPLERAKQLVQEFSKGGKIVPKYETATGECPEGYKKNAEGECEKLDKEEAEALSFVPEGQSRDISTSLFGEVTPESFQASKDRNKWFFDQNPNFDVTDSNQVLQYQRQYNQIAERLGAPTVSEDGKWGQQTDSIDVRKFYKTTPLQEEEIVAEAPEAFGGVGPYLFPNESPLPPSALQGTIKIEPRFDRVRPTEIDVEPYLQDIKDREEAQVQSLEGLSPNVRAAVLANMRANNQKAESDVRNQIDTQNLQSQEKAIYTNAQIQQREENSNNRERLMYEMRQYKSQANTDNDIRNYFNKLQELNAQRFEDIHNLNLNNAQDESIYFDGQRFRRKQGQSDQNLMRKILRRLEE